MSGIRPTSTFRNASLKEDSEAVSDDPPSSATAVVLAPAADATAMVSTTSTLRTEKVFGFMLLFSAAGGLCLHLVGWR
jgi:hypothetical protein